MYSSTSEKIKRLEDLIQLLNTNTITKEEFEVLKFRLIADNDAFPKKLKPKKSFFRRNFLIVVPLIIILSLWLYANYIFDSSQIPSIEYPENSDGTRKLDFNGIMLYLQYHGLKGEKVDSHLLKTYFPKAFDTVGKENRLKSDETSDIVSPSGKSIPKYSVVKSLLMEAEEDEMERVLGKPSQTWRFPNGDGDVFLYFFSVIDDIDNKISHIAIAYKYDRDYGSMRITEIKIYKPGEYIPIGYGGQNIPTPKQK